MISIAKIWDFFYLFSSYSSSGPFEPSLHENFSKIIFFKLLPHMKLHIFPKFTAVCIMRSKFCE